MKYKNLKIIREQNGLTQQQLADVLGISRSAYCGYETGRRTPDIETLEKIVKFYNMPVEVFFTKLMSEYLYDDEFVNKQPEATYLIQLSKEEKDLIVSFKLMDDKAKAESLAIIKEKSGRKSL